MSFALVLVVAVLLAGCPAFAERQPYDNYQSIVDRQMFGPLPEDFDPTRLPSEAKASQKRGKQAENLTKEQEKLKSAVHFSVLNVTPDGTVKVGFTDRSDAKNPRNYYLGVGESRDGWVVKEADPDAATMTVEKGEIEITLAIGGDSAKSDQATKKAGANVASDAGSRRSGLLGLNKTLNRKLTRKEERQKSAEEIERIRKEAEQRVAEQEAARKKEHEEFVAGQEAMRQDLVRLQQQIQADRQKTEEAAKRNANTEGESDEDNDAE